MFDNQQKVITIHHLSKLFLPDANIRIVPSKLKKIIQKHSLIRLL